MASHSRHAARTQEWPALPAGRAPLPLVMAPAAERQAVRRLGAVCILVFSLISPPSLSALEEARDQKVKSTFSDMRAIAIAVEAYRVDNDVYPERELGDVSGIRGFVQPTYIREFPANDAWGNSILYASSGDTYLIWSFGADQEPDSPPVGGSTEYVGADLIIANGDLWQAPRGFCCVGPIFVANPFDQIREECPRIFP